MRHMPSSRSASGQGLKGILPRARVRNDSSVTRIDKDSPVPVLVTVQRSYATCMHLYCSNRWGSRKVPLIDFFYTKYSKKKSNQIEITKSNIFPILYNTEASGTFEV